MLRATLLIEGQIQGVGYRALVSTIAHDLKINGKVKNLLDGRVEVVCECSGEAEFREFLRLLARRDGYIKVSRITVSEKKEVEKPEYKWFFVDR